MEKEFRIEENFHPTDVEKFEMKTLISESKWDAFSYVCQFSFHLQKEKFPQLMLNTNARCASGSFFASSNYKTFHSRKIRLIFRHICRKRQIFRLICTFCKNNNQIGQKRPNTQSFYSLSIIWAEFDKYIQIFSAESCPAKFDNLPMFRPQNRKFSEFCRTVLNSTYVF